MGLEFKNGDINSVVLFLSQQTLPRKVFRASSFLVDKLTVKLSDYAKSEQKLVESLKGSISEEGNISFENSEDFNKFKTERDDLNNETVIIEPNYKEQFSIFKKYFDDWDGSVEPQYSQGVNALYNSLEKLNEDVNNKEQVIND